MHITSYLNWFSVATNLINKKKSKKANYQLSTKKWKML